MSRQGAVAQNVNVVDVIAEGPIDGLVGGLSGIYLDDVPVEEAKFSATTGAQEENAPATATITFSGTHTGTVSENISLAEIDRAAIKSLTLLDYYSTKVTITNISKTDESSVATLSTAPRAVWTEDWESGSRGFGTGQNAAFLYKDDVVVFGNFKIANGKNGNFTVLSDYLLEDGEEYTLVIHQTRQIKTISGNAGTIKVKGQRIGSAPPNSGTYNFILNGSVLYDEDGATVVLESNLKKINKLNVDFRKGEVNQLPVASVGGVGAAVGVTGNTNLISGPQELKMIDETLATNLGFTLFNIEGLPNTDPNNDDYPGLPDKSDLATTATVIPASAFGLDTGAKIREVDQVIVGINYGAFQTLNLEGGDKETAYAFYQMHIRFEQNNSYGPWYKLFGNSDSLVRHRGQTDAPVEFDHVVNIEGYRRALGQFTDFQFRICRVSRHIGMGVNYDGTPGQRTDKNKWQIQAKASVSRLSATIKDYFAYPYSALASLSFSSRQFDGLPKRSYLLRGKLVKIPTTYTPREYSDTGIAKYEEFWDGNFRQTPFYTDNPAWVFYDIVTNNRYGAGKWIKEEDIDKYALYRIARYCDELVDDGSEYDSTKQLKLGSFYKIHSSGDTNWSAVGASSSTAGTIFQATDTTFTGTGILYGVEPRFRANIFLTKATEAYKVLKDFATVFLGILYAQDSKITAVQDAPQDPVYTFTKGNIIDGSFTYESTGSRTRINQCVVTWNDPTINYEPVPLVVEDRESIVRTGRIISENVVAFGATSESQAIRYGKWKLWTAQNQTEMVSFKTSLAAYYVKPGDVINVQDADRFGISYSGRTSSATSTTLTFDRDVSFNSGSTYELSTLVTAPAALNAASSSITINDTNGNGTTYAQGEKIDFAWVYSDTDTPADGSRDSYVYTALDTEEKASNAFLDSTGSELIPTIWKPYSYVETHEITNPGNTSNSVTLANSATFDTTPSKHNIWALQETSGGVNTAASKKMYKILSISEESPNTFAIAAVEYFDEKYIAVEGEYELGTLPDSVFIQNEPVDIPRPINPRVILASDRKNPGEELVLEWENPGSDAIVSYEVAHNIADVESPILTDDTNVRLNNIPNGGLLFRIRAVSRKGNKSSPTTLSYEVYDVFDENVPRMKHGIAKGAISTAQGKINASNQFEFQATNTSIASITNPFITYTITGAKNVANISTNEPYYMYLDTATPSLKLLEYDNSALTNMQFYRDVGSGNTSISAAWTSIGTISIDANSNEITGSGFNTNVELRDTLNLSNSTSPSGGDGARVVSIISDTRLLIDRTFDTAKTNITGYRSTFRPDYANDCIFAEITKTGSTISTNNFITLRSSSDDTEGTTETLDDGTIAVKDGGISVDKIAANSITADKIQANAISAREIDADSINANHIVAGEITADAIAASAITTDKLAANAITADKVTANSVVATLLTASAVTATEISATNLSSISANIGDITAGTLKGGNIPDANSAPAGSESGAFLNLTGGKMVFGNASKYVLFDGTNLELNGVVIDASSTVNATATPELIVKEDGTAEITDAASLNFTSGLNVAVSGTEATISLDTPTDNNFTSALLSKLNGIESGATADQTAAEIRVLVGSATDSNVFTDTLLSKLNGIANNANNYSLPTASPTVLGGIKIGNRVSITSGVLSADIQSDNNFTTTLKNKLDGIESGATGDQTAAEIRSLVESATDSNVFTDADHTKLNNIESGATGDQTASEIRALVASASDSNVFTDADHTKLDGIESGATADQTAAEIRTLVESASDSNVFTDADHTKLNGIATGANAYVLPTNNVTNASVSGSTLTLTREGASNVTFTDTNTQYSAGSGLGLSGTTFSVDSTVVRTTGTQTIGGAKTFTGDVTFNGTTTYINTTTLNVGDNIITLNADFTGSNPTESAGIEIERGTQANALFQYKESGVGITGDLAAGWSVGTSRIEATGFYGTFYGDASNLSNINADSLSGLSTADLAEDPSATTSSGTMYFTNARARAALSGGTGISYNSTTGAIVNSAPDQTVSLTGGGATSVSGTYPNFTISSTDTNTVPNNATITISAGTDLTTGGNFTTDQNFAETITINHANIGRTNNTSASSPGYGGTFTAIDSITTNARGHVTAVNTKTVTIPASDNTDTNTVTQIREDSGTYRTGNITLQSGTNVTISEPSAGVFNFAATDTNTTNFNIQASGGTATNISAGETINFTGGGATSVSRSGNTITFTSTDTNTDTNNYVSSVSFATSTGVLTLNRAGLGALTVDLDGRYSTSDTNYFLDGISKSGNTLTFSVSGATNQSYTFGSNAFTSTTIPTNNNQLTNGAGYTTNTGTVTSVAVSAGTGLSGGGTVTTSGTISLAVDLSELADMTAAVDTSVDELILLDNGAERRKRFAEIFGSNAYNSTTIPTNNNQLTNGAGYTTNTGTVTSVSGGTGLSGTVTTSGSLNLTNTGVSAATYGNSTNIPQIAVDAQGRITSASNVAVSIPSGANDATITLSAGNGLTGGESFTTDQASNETITFNVGAGDGISVAANAVAVDSTVLRAGTGSLINDIINANVITADMIQANSIVATIITAEEITASHIATNTITANEIAAGAITASELQISNNSGGSAGIFMDYNSGNSRIDIRDSSALRVRIGYLA